MLRHPGDAPLTDGRDRSRGWTYRSLIVSHVSSSVGTTIPKPRFSRNTARTSSCSVADRERIARMPKAWAASPMLLVTERSSPTKSAWAEPSCSKIEASVRSRTRSSGAIQHLGGPRFFERSASYAASGRVKKLKVGDARVTAIVRGATPVPGSAMGRGRIETLVRHISDVDLGLHLPTYGGTTAAVTGSRSTECANLS